MKKLLLTLAIVALLATPAFASRPHLSCDGPLAGILNKCIVQPEETKSQLIVGAKIDMPYLIRFTTNWTLGLEAGKDMYSDPFRDRGFALEDDEGYFGYIKITYTGTWFDFSKK